MNYWLMKSEPSTYSWDQLVKDKKTGWNGVRNFQASANLRAMKIGDRVFKLLPGTKVTINGKDAKAADLKAGDKVTITLTTDESGALVIAGGEKTKPGGDKSKPEKEEDE